MIGCVTSEAIAESNKAAYMAAGAPAVHGVPSAAECRIGRQQGDAAGIMPGALVPVSRSDVRAGDYQRPYITEGHGAQSPSNGPGAVPTYGRPQ